MAKALKVRRKSKAPILINKNAYVAYMDILGFRELLNNKDFRENVESIVGALRERMSFDGRHYPQLRYLAISDTIIITADIREGRALCRKIGQVQNALLKLGFAVRGAITFGPILTYGGRTGWNIFGSTFVNAYTTEQDLAIYPRVVIAKDCVRRLKDDIKESTGRAMKTFILRDQDGVNFVNQFSHDVIWLSSYLTRRTLARSHREQFHKSIVAALKATASEPKANMKWRWLKRQLDEQLGE